jgi:hypothetical protein
MFLMATLIINGSGHSHILPSGLFWEELHSGIWSVSEILVSLFHLQIYKNWLHVVEVNLLAGPAFLPPLLSGWITGGKNAHLFLCLLNGEPIDFNVHLLRVSCSYAGRVYVQGDIHHERSKYYLAGFQNKATGLQPSLSRKNNLWTGSSEPWSNKAT